MVSNGCWPKLVPRHYGQTILESSSPNHHCQIQVGAQCFGSTPPHATADQMQSCPWIARRSSMNAYGMCMLYIYVFISVSVCMSTYVYLFISSHLSYVIHINPLKKMAQFRPRRHGVRIRGGQDVDGHQRCLCTTGSTAGEATDQVRCAAAIAFFAPWQRKGSWMMG